MTLTESLFSLLLIASAVFAQNSSHHTSECPFDASVWTHLSVDMVFVIDVSSFVNSDSFGAISLAPQLLPIGQGPKDTRLALVTAGRQAKLNASLTAFATPWSAVTGVSAILNDANNFVDDDSANINDALQLAANELLQNGRPSGGQVIVVLSAVNEHCSQDGGDPPNPECALAASIISSGVSVVSVSLVGNTIDLGNGPCKQLISSDQTLISGLMREVSFAGCYCAGGADNDYIQVVPTNTSDCRKFAECVKISTLTTTESTAEGVCADDQSTLATVFDKAKLDFLTAFNAPPNVPRSYYPYFLGLKGAAPDGLVWPDGSKLNAGDYAPWSIQPTNGVQTCVSVQRSGLDQSPKWVPTNCTTRAYAICQQPACSPTNLC